MKNVLISGANRGIGLATANIFKSSGFNVIATARKNTDIENLSQQGFISSRLDVSESSSIDELYSELKDKDLLPDILINNAGIAHVSLLSRLDENQLQNILDVNLKGSILLTKKFIRNMSKNKFGRVINVSSILSSYPQKGFAAYSASKAGLEAFSRVTALEYADKGVTVNCIAAGFVNTDMIQGLSNSDVLKSQIPIKNIAEAHDIAESIFYLASQRNITGEVLQSNGGLMMKP
ncbi:SDR family NAD(P)-dependent oxidoreductase [Vibrio sp. OCN044]|uniref:SDR family NAD(P)-dependent oxidoreductase n=1 Tax=Vibrio tetraodonis subsp. pristinus TaxID=2695891 RepID=A0A6L8M5D4_9VIBR|nr:SDR family NAD(P)-dependent oxidoreductase [Vibrio tetraodonis]MYM61499.1 SDR family NAD(P)-dependent oxidoreductase [Vibrio tetraodonis subsp. pristinus]